MNQEEGLNENFENVISNIKNIGQEYHGTTLEDNARRNLPYIKKTIKDLPLDSLPCRKKAIVISAGPSLHKFNTVKRIKESGFDGLKVGVDGSYIKSLKQGLVPDVILTLDPHPTRMVRWFGDHDFEENSRNDDYFTRQDLDVDFREKSIKANEDNIKLVNKYAHQTKLLISSSSPINMVERAMEAGFDMYWWNPLVDDPRDPDSITRKLYEINKLPCVNTGGNVGTAAWAFASTIFKAEEIAVTGMDLGYHEETPIEMTQTYYELATYLKANPGKMEEMFKWFEFPLDGKKYYTDPTYYWYRQNILELIENAPGKTYNCSEAGILFGPQIPCLKLEEFIEK